MSNLNEMMKIAERGTEFLYYMRDFYSLEHNGVYGAELNFTDEEIVDGINEYMKDYEVLKGLLKYGADTVDRERVRDIILNMRGE